MIKGQEMPVRERQAGARQRRVLFLSHATPEDNAFAAWLASQLAIAGYEVWCDVTALLGGERFWENIEEAIDQATFRFLFVSTLEANRKQGTLRELSLAQQACDQHGLGEFIIPLKIDAFPFSSMQDSIQDLNMVRFDGTWAHGLRQLLALLEREGTPKSEATGANAVMDWYNRSLDSDRQPVRARDTYLSNWFNLRLPAEIYAHCFRGPADTLSKLADGFSCPNRTVGQRLLTFAPGHEVQTALGGGWAEDDVAILKTLAFLKNGAPQLGIAPFDASNMVTDLVRQAWESEMARQGLCAFRLASGLKAWFFPHGYLEKNKAYFTPEKGRRTYRQLVGTKSRRTRDGGKETDGYWHYAVSASLQLHPFPRVVLRHHVIFTDDGETPWTKANRMQKARRGVCKQWWNREWRDRLLAFCAQLSGGHDRLSLSTGGDDISAAMKPMRFVSPVTYFEDGETVLDETQEVELIEDTANEDEDDEDAEDRAAP